MISRDHLSYEAIPLPDRATLSDDAMRAAAKSFYEAMKKRHSVRDFSDKPVAREVIEDCIRTAGSAPSGANHQPWHFVAIGDVDIKRRIRLALRSRRRSERKVARARAYPARCRARDHARATRIGS